MDLIVTSDLHGTLPKIEKTDVVCICGDIFPLEIQRNTCKSLNWLTSIFFEWVRNLQCGKVIIVGGNHDFIFYWLGKFEIRKIISDCWLEHKLIYLDNSSYVYNDIIFYGCPSVEHISDLWAFHSNGKEFYDIPYCDVLLTHQPPNVGKISTSCWGNWGSEILKKVIENQHIRYHFCGHVHEGSHTPVDYWNTHIQNVAYKNEDYNPTFEPISISI